MKRGRDKNAGDAGVLKFDKIAGMTQTSGGVHEPAAGAYTRPAVCVMLAILTNSRTPTSPAFLSRPRFMTAA